MKVQGKFKMQALTSCDAKVVSTRTGQFKGQFKGAMDARSGKVQDVSTPHYHRRGYNQQCCGGYCNLQS